MKFKNLFRSNKEKEDSLKINLLNRQAINKEQRTQIFEIAISGLNSGKSLKNIASEISEKLNIQHVQVYRHIERIDIVI